MEEKRDGAKWRGEGRVKRGETCENSGQEEKVLSRRDEKKEKEGRSMKRGERRKKN
jgi:hypothetical protein